MTVAGIVDGVPSEGVEDWWDDVEAAAHQSPDQYPLLVSVSPYADWFVPADRLGDLADERVRLAEHQSDTAKRSC